MISGGSIDHWHQYGLRWKHRPWTSFWPGTLSLPQAAVLTTNTNMASRRSMDHGDLSWRSNKENELFFTILPTLLHNSKFHHQLKPSLTLITAGVAISASLHQIRTTSFLRLSHFCITYSFVGVFGNGSVSHSNFFAQTPIHANIHYNKLLVLF